MCPNKGKLPTTSLSQHAYLLLDVTTKSPEMGTDISQYITDSPTHHHKCTSVYRYTVGQMVHLARQPHRNEVVSKTDGNLHSSEHDMEVEATYTHAFAHDTGKGLAMPGCCYNNTMYTTITITR